MTVFLGHASPDCVCRYRWILGTLAFPACRESLAGDRPTREAALQTTRRLVLGGTRRSRLDRGHIAGVAVITSCACRASAGTPVDFRPVRRLVPRARSYHPGEDSRQSSWLAAFVRDAGDRELVVDLDSRSWGLADHILTSDIGPSTGLDAVGDGHRHGVDPKRQGPWDH